MIQELPDLIVHCGWSSAIIHFDSEFALFGNGLWIFATVKGPYLEDGGGEVWVGV